MDNPLREVRMIIACDADEPLSTEVSFEEILLEQFRGYTKTYCDGGYVSDDGTHAHENALVYDIAVPVFPDYMPLLRRVADRAKVMFRQEKIYLRDTKGGVSIG